MEIRRYTTLKTLALMCYLKPLNLLRAQALYKLSQRSYVSIQCLRGYWCSSMLHLYTVIENTGLNPFTLLLGCEKSCRNEQYSDPMGKCSSYWLPDRHWLLWGSYFNGLRWYYILSSTLPEIDPDTAYVVCISASLGYTALLSVISLTTFNGIVSASVTKSMLVCFVVTVHWWRHRTHYDVTEACRALRNIPTVHLNNGAPRADLRWIPKYCEVTSKAGRQSTIYGWFWCDFLYH